MYLAPGTLRRAFVAGALAVFGVLSPLRAQSETPPTDRSSAEVDDTAAWDVDALAKTFTTPAQAFQFVRDQIAAEPYRGVMKGAAGTLLTRGRNDWDRALLLAKLLQAQGVDCAIARAPLALRATADTSATFRRGPTAVEHILATRPAMR